MATSTTQAARRWADALQQADRADWDAISNRELRRLSADTIEKVSEVVEAMSSLKNNSAVPVTLISAKPLTDPMQAEIVKSLFDKRAVAITAVVDASLIGGVVVQTADHLWDLSIKHQLERLKRSIVEV